MRQAPRSLLVSVALCALGLAACSSDKLHGDRKDPSVPAQQAPFPSVLLLPRFVDFGVVTPTDPPQTANVRVINSGNVAWELRSVTLAASGPFSVAPALGVVAPGAETSLTVTFAPTADGGYEVTGALAFDLDLGNVTLALAGARAAAPPPPPPPVDPPPPICEGGTCFARCETDCGPIYAHSASALYSIDPTTLEISAVATFHWPTWFPKELTDLAASASGDMYGVDYTGLWRVDPATAELTDVDLVDQDLRMNGLSFVRLGTQEALLASTADGEILRLDPANANVLWTGHMGGGLVSHGDLVYGESFGILGAARGGDSSSRLVRIDATTGAATEVATLTGHVVFGMALWQSHLYAFTEAGKILVIDPATGAIQDTRSTSVHWNGAATPPVQ